MGRMSKNIQKYHKIEKKSRFTFNNIYEIIKMSRDNYEMVINAFWAAYAIGYYDAKKSTLASINGNDAPGTKAEQLQSESMAAVQTSTLARGTGPMRYQERRRCTRNESEGKNELL